MSLRPRLLSLCVVTLAAAMPLAAMAEDIVGADAVLSDVDLGQCTTRPWVDAFGDCLATLGAPEAVVGFAERLRTDPAIAAVGVMTAFDERGVVDAADVTLPTLANSNVQTLLVNGAEPIVPLSALVAPAPEDRISQTILVEHPEAMLAGPPDLAGYRDLPGGVQRFVIEDRITDGCRACAVLGRSITQVDFQDGAQIALTSVAWVPSDVALSPAAAEEAILNGDVAVLQYWLNRGGYDVGGTDGITGPRTRGALEAFLSEHCLPSLIEEPEFRPPSVAVLVGLAPSNCNAPDNSVE